MLLDSGGLHVIMSYMPSNMRVELQGFGRSGRKGDKGSGRMIIHSNETPYSNKEIISENVSMLNALEYLREERDMREEQRLQEIRIKMIPRVMLERDLFDRFDKMQNIIKNYFLEEKVTKKVLIN